MKMKAAFWAQHVAAAARETMSASAYAKRHGLAAKSLYYWQNKLKATALTSEVSRPAGKFVALRMVDAAITPRPTTARCYFPLACVWKCRHCPHPNGWLPLDVPHKEHADAPRLSDYPGVPVPCAD